MIIYFHSPLQHSQMQYAPYLLISLDSNNRSIRLGFSAMAERLDRKQQSPKLPYLISLGSIFPSNIFSSILDYVSLENSFALNHLYFVAFGNATKSFAMDCIWGGNSLSVYRFYPIYLSIFQYLFISPICMILSQIVYFYVLIFCSFD